MQVCRACCAKLAGYVTKGDMISNDPARVVLIRELVAPAADKTLRSQIHSSLYYARLCPACCLSSNRQASCISSRQSRCSVSLCHVNCLMHILICSLFANNMSVQAIDPSNPLHARPDAFRSSGACMMGQYNAKCVVSPIAHSLPSVHDR